MGDPDLLIDAASTYERDFFAWTRAQAAALRAAATGDNAQLDYQNIAEEIESLGSRDRRELGSRIATIIEHLLKLQFSPAAAPRPGWMATIRRERDEIERILAASPSLRRELAAIVPKENRRVVARTLRELVDRGEVDRGLTAPSYADDQVLVDWWPASPT